MNMIVGKIEQLYTDLVKKDESMEKECALIKHESCVVDRKREILIQMEKEIKDREKAISKHESIDDERDKLSISIKNHVDIKKENCDKQDELNSREKALNILELALNKKKKTLSVQAIALKERETDFDAKRKDLKDIISGKAVRELVK